jgi:hypothetical protein
MRRAISAFCCFIVCLQILIGVPLAVCIAFFAIVGGGAYPVTVDVRAGREFSPPVTIPPPNVIPTAASEPHDNPILVSRAQQGSPLAGTILSEVTDQESEHDLFVAALEKVAIESAAEPAQSPITRESPTAESVAARPTDNFIVRRLYEMADADEGDGRFDRADQWRAYAREIREHSALASSDDAPPTAP